MPLGLRRKRSQCDLIPAYELPSETQSAEHQRAELKNRGRTQQHHTKAEVVVAEVRKIPEADGTTSVV